MTFERHIVDFLNPAFNYEQTFNKAFDEGELKENTVFSGHYDR